MMKMFVRTAAVVLLVVALPVIAGAQGAAQVTPAAAAPFLGDWTLALQGPNGPGTFTLSVNTDKDKVTAEIGSDQMPKAPISSISLVDKSLVLGWSFTYEGNPVEAVVSLTPDKEGKTAAQIDFAGGAYVMSGTATKKEKAKEELRIQLTRGRAAYDVHISTLQRP